MKNNILLASLLPFFTSYVWANASGEIFTKININAQMSDEGGDSFSEIKSNNSWAGVKGSYQLANDLEAVYHLEWKIDITGESGKDNISARPQFVGIKGDFGRVTIGRQFTPT